MSVVEITSVEHFKSVLDGAGSKLVVIDFTAAWCGPCKMIAPTYHELAHTYGGKAVFCKCDVDTAQPVALQEKVHAMPTFIFYVKGKRVDELCGADGSALKEKVKNLVGQHSVFSSKGYSLLSGSSTASSSSKSAVKAPTKQINPWADPNFVPPGMRQSAPSNVSKEEKPALAFRPHGPKTPWSDPSFLPSPAEITPKPPAPERVQKPAETADDVELAKAIAMSLDAEQSTSESQNDPSLVSKVDQNLLSELLDMGFPRIRVEKSLILIKEKTMEAATNWLIEHEQDPDIDEPLTLVGTAPSKDAISEEIFDDEDDGLSEAIRSVREKAARAKEEVRKQALEGQESVDMSKMTKEEKLAYIERLKAARKVQREKQHREDAKQKEVERQQNVKAALEAKRAREQQQAAMAAARAKREKEAERARQKRVEEKLRQDKEARIKAKLEREQQKAQAANPK